MKHPNTKKAPPIGARPPPPPQAPQTVPRRPGTPEPHPVTESSFLRTRKPAGEPEASTRPPPTPHRPFPVVNGIEQNHACRYHLPVLPEGFDPRMSRGTCTALKSTPASCGFASASAQGCSKFGARSPQRPRP